MKAISLKDARDLIDGVSDKYNFIARAKGESYKWSKDIRIIFNDINKPKNLFAFNYSKGLIAEQEDTIDTIQHFAVSLYDNYSNDTSDDTVEIYSVRLHTN